jgi:two-component system, cell cycle sensor histidine kinase and response regulator CckA
MTVSVETESHSPEAQSGQAKKLDAVGRLASRVAHDFNNILTVIHGCSDFLAASLTEDDPRRADAVMIREASARAAGLTAQLLSFATNQAAESAVVDLNACITALQPRVIREVGDAVVLTIDLAPDIGRVSVDPGRLECAILDMAANARDAMPNGGGLLLTTRNYFVTEADIRRHPEATPGPHVRLSISDTGRGMDDATLARIFEPFFTTKEPRGLGLALATVYGMTRQASGHMSVKSAPGAGTKFDILLPVVEGAANTSPTPAADGRPGQGREVILIVEDDAGVLSLASRMLTDDGYAVIEAANGAEALSTVRAWGGNVDLVITDAMMPVMNGGELADALAAEYPRVKVLFMSLYTGDDIVRRGPDSRRAFMPKPFTATGLMRKVREVLDAGESS